MAEKRNLPVVVIGLGRFGSALALELIQGGTEVLGIDNRATVVQSLSGHFTHVVTADTTDDVALRQLGVAEFHNAVVAIGSDLEASILTTSLLVDMGIPNIWAKAVSRQHGRILERLGAHHVILPEHDMGERVAHLISGRVLDYVEIDEDFAMIKTKPPRDFVGVPLGKSGLRKSFGVTIVSVKPQAPQVTPARFTHATTETVLQYGDEILVVGKIADVERFAETQ